MLNKFFATFFENDFVGKGKELYTAHYENVRSMVPKEKLMEFHISDGWDPLCKFLGEPVPFGCKFPHINDNSDFVTRSKRRNRMQLANVLFRYFVILVGLVLAYFMAGSAWERAQDYKHLVF